MFTSTLFTAILASTAVLVARADVNPNSPSPGDSFTVGGQCTLGWAGDSSGTGVWKDMSIELMTGSNEKMVHLTTVATGQDGTVDGTFSYTCPDVSPNAQVYFYQFTSCSAANTTWTGRFTIAAADGSTVAPTQSELFDLTTEVFFGTATLATPSAASAAPTCNIASGSASVTGNPAISTSAPVSSSGFSSSKKLAAASSGPSSEPSSSSAASSGSSAAQATGSSAALAAGPLAVDTRMWPVVVALSASALAFTILL